MGPREASYSMLWLLGMCWLCRISCSFDGLGAGIGNILISYTWKPER
jgi:hypothetical protein